MAVTINLLPGDLKVSRDVSKALSIFRMLGVIGLTLFLIFGLGLAAFFIYSNIQLNNLNSSNEGLKAQLSNLSTTESQFFLLKDRLSKIAKVESIPSSTKNLEDFELLVANMQNTSVGELDISPGKMSATINFGSNADLKNFIELVSKSQLYSSVILASFGFNPSSGYTTNFVITPK